MKQVLLIGSWPSNAAAWYQRALSVAGIQADVRDCGKLSWDEARELLRQDGCLGGVVSRELAPRAYECIDMVAASARLTGGVSLIVAKRGKLLGFNTVGAGVVAALQHEGFDLHIPQACVLGGDSYALSCIVALSQEGVDAVSLLGDDKEKTKETLQHLLDLMERASFATMMLSAADDGKRTLRQAYEDVAYKVGSMDASARVIAASALVIDARAGEDRADITGQGEVAKVLQVESESVLRGRAATDAQSLSSIFNPDAAPQVSALLDALR